MRSAAINPAVWPTMLRRGGTGPDVTVFSEPGKTARTADGLTLGVEEEFVLLDPSTGDPVMAGPDLARQLDTETGVQAELMRFQLETATGVCTSLDDVGSELARLRRLAAHAAASAGCRLVASGTAPYHTPGLAAVTDQPRYRELARYYGPLVAKVGGTCGCHVHVGVPSRDLGVQVLARLRPWLAPLLAITVNSPISDGCHTAWASSRYRAWSRWPTAAPPEVWPDAAAYDAAVSRLISRGAALDEQSIYLFARLSPRYPTVEVRIADVCLDTGATALLAGLTRALVATALAEANRGTPVPAAPAPWVDASLTAAARHGLAGAGVDPFTGHPADAPSLRNRLLDHVYPALRNLGDAQTITRLLHRLDDRGTGADRQRALFASTVSAAAFVEALARATLSGDEPAGGSQPETGGTNGRGESRPPEGLPSSSSLTRTGCTGHRPLTEPPTRHGPTSQDNLTARAVHQHASALVAEPFFAAQRDTPFRSATCRPRQARSRAQAWRLNPGQPCRAAVSSSVAVMLLSNAVHPVRRLDQVWVFRVRIHRAIRDAQD